MGELIDCKCKKCDNSWIRYQGEGMMAIFYHCSECGKEISLDKSNNPILRCECGGYCNSLDNPIICPECNSIDIETDPVGDWD
ncbi:DNA-directed RNA polymerase subunit RPC12/RpoP [Parabacteroides sp. PF5-9]|nr:DNA-directed RNA polymerase subunit RPC12/RpoP [Parabacteroides sp. PF5-9]